MTRAVIYCRVSSQEQASEGKTSIATQLGDCRILAARLGWHVAAELVDDKRYRVGKRMVEPSGERSDRPQWRKMLQLLTSGQADAVLTWHSTRLYRAYRPFVDFLDVVEAHNVKVELVKEHWDKDTAIFNAWMAKKENESRKQRVVFGLAGRAKQGRPPTSHSSFFKPIIEPATGEKLGYEFDEHHRAYFDQMARLYIDRHTYHAIARLLGPSPVTGRNTSHVTVRSIMHNPYYRGRLDFGRSTGSIRFSVPTAHRAVWDASTIAAIEAESARRHKFKSPRSTTIPLAGILFCGWCGGLMAAASRPDKGQPFGRPYRQYVCQRPSRRRQGENIPGADHPPNTIAENKLLHLLQAEIDQLSSLDTDDALAFIAANVPAETREDAPERAEMLNIESQIAELEPELQRVHSTVAKVAIDAELSRLRERATMLARHLESNEPVQMVDFAKLQAGWAALRVSPPLYELSDADLRSVLTAVFPAIYVASGAIVPAPPPV